MKQGGIEMSYGKKFLNALILVVTVVGLLVFVSASSALSQPLTGGTVDPLSIPKYVIPLVIPPVMKDISGNNTTNSYEISVRQFKQQILPGGIWNSLNGRKDKFRPTKVWSYGPEADLTPKVAPDSTSQFNYPAYTIETTSNLPFDAANKVYVKWINGLVDKNGKFLQHLLPVDQTLHWANPSQDCADGTVTTDCVGQNPKRYKGPIPIVVHVHGSHVEPHSDGFPEAWWLPAATNIHKGYATEGSLYDDSVGHAQGLNLGYADFSYRNDQPATTLWYHDHSLGMTRLNVYAGPAGFWLIRGGINGDAFVDDGTTATANDGKLPGPAPVAGDTLLELNLPSLVLGTIDKRSGVREIPVVIQDRSFDKNGAKLFYPDDRAFFEGVEKDQLKIDFAPISDVPPIWQPEAFFNVMVVNGVSWPQLDVAQSLYRFRLLNGCNSRFLNLALQIVSSSNPALVGTEIPFYQIGAEEGFLDKVVRIKTGEATPLPGNGTDQTAVATPVQQALLMGNAERADVIVDFRDLPDGTVVRMINTGPDEPFGGFPAPTADPSTTGQVMQFVVKAALNGNSTTDPIGATPATDPLKLVLPNEDALGVPDNTRNVSLNEAESAVVCVLLDVDADAYFVPIKQVDCAMPDPDGVIGAGSDVVPFGPTMAKLGIMDGTNTNPIPLNWDDTTGVSTPKTVTLQSGVQMMVNVTENSALDSIEEWHIHNFTEDAHPIHIHMVRFNVVGREVIGGGTSVSGSNDPQSTETGYKDTIIAYPGEITKVKAKFDIPGLFVWHCHIVEHEDNEMMRPYFVGDPDDSPIPVMNGGM